MSDLPPSEAVLSFLRDVQRQLVAAGAMPGQDFVVNRVTDEVASGDDHGLRPTGDGFAVYYDERGDRRVLLSHGRRRPSSVVLRGSSPRHVADAVSSGVHAHGRACDELGSARASASTGFAADARSA